MKRATEIASFSLPSEYLKWLREEAKKNDRTTSGMLAHILAGMVGRKSKK